MAPQKNGCIVKLTWPMTFVFYYRLVFWRVWAIPIYKNTIGGPVNWFFTHNSRRLIEALMLSGASKCLSRSSCTSQGVAVRLSNNMMDMMAGFHDILLGWEINKNLPGNLTWTDISQNQPALLKRILFSFPRWDMWSFPGGFLAGRCRVIWNSWDAKAKFKASSKH